ncbi:MAG: hypothetical protein EOP00_29700 [Pedobacter sp.]|nr:MAG: hypothetical protein EOP00_29700 [Pedobacter sp.]
MNNVKYPPKAADNNIQGRVYVAIIIDENGKPRNYNAVTNLGSGLEEEALRVIKLLPGEYILAFKNEKPVESVIKMSLIYVLQ